MIEWFMVLRLNNKEIDIELWYYFIWGFDVLIEIAFFLL